MAAAIISPQLVTRTQKMRFGSVCSGIEAASVAWHPLGWRASFLSEIEAFPRAVLSHHYPDVPLHGDFTTIEAGRYDPIDVLVGGTPCQSFSVAGLRGGLADDRGNLALEYLRLADRLRPKWLVWENVPGVLSSNGGRDFGSILGGLVELGYGFAYRVLDAQFFGVAQRRRRVFVVGHAGDWRRAAAVLFERHSLSGHPAPSRQRGEGAARCLTRGSGGGQRYNAETETFVAHALRAEGFDASEDGTGRGTPLVPVSFTGGASECLSMEDCAHPVTGRNGDPGMIAFDVAQITSAANRTRCEPGLPVSTLSKDSRMHVASSAVRRLTPRECERLQGFPDDYTLIPWRKGMAPDGPRYKALGNSMAVPVMAWIGRRIEAVEALSSTELAA
jgi:DNA (cytosine-5)-methyltransferase 1